MSSCFKSIIKYKVNILHIILIVLCGIISSTFLFSTTRCLAGGDGYFHIDRMLAIAANIEKGNFPARMSTTFWNGYGNATLIMYPQTFIYIPTMIYRLTDNYCLAFNAFLILINVLTGILMYVCQVLIFKKYSDDKVYNIAFIASILWIFAPYRLTDLYVRVAVGELLGAMFFPFFVLGTYYLLADDCKKWPVFVIASTCVFRSHILSSFFCIVIFIILFIFNIRNMSFKRFGVMILSFFVTLIINLNELIPMMEYMNSYEMVMPFKTVLNDEALKLETFINQTVENYSIQFIFLILLILSVTYAVLLLIKRASKWYIYMQFTFMAVFFTFITSQLFNWENPESIAVLKRILDSLQFPWRLSMVASFFIAIISSHMIYSIIQKIFNERYRVLGYVGIFILIICIYTPYTHYNYSYGSFRRFGNTDYMHSKSVLWEALNYYDGNLIYEKDKIDITNLKKDLNALSFDYELKEISEGKVVLPLFNFPGYVCRDENNDINEITENFNAQIEVTLTKSKGAVNVRFEGKKLWNILDIVSFSSLMVLILYTICAYYIGLKIKKE